MKYTSKNPSVASVTEQGTVVGVATGSTVIEVKEDTGEYRGQIPTTVVANDSSYIPVTGVSLNKTSVKLKYAYDFSKQLKATVTPANATNKTLTWTSSNPTALSVKNGYLKCLENGTGTFTVTATSADGPTATCTVTIVRNGTVVNSVSPTNIVLDSSKATSIPIKVDVTNFDGYYSGYTAYSNDGATGVNQTETGFTLNISENKGSARTITFYVQGNFSGDTAKTITISQPYNPDASGFGPHCEYYIANDQGVIVGYETVETYFLASGGTSYRHVYDDTGRCISGSADIEIRCANEAVESIYNRTTTSASWVHKRGYFNFSYWNIGISVDPNTTGVARDAEVYIPGGLVYKVHQDA